LPITLISVLLVRGTVDTSVAYSAFRILR
jgi:hypothetical protein